MTKRLGIRRLLCMFMVAVFVLSLPPTMAASEGTTQTQPSRSVSGVYFAGQGASQFRDVASGDWFYSAVDYAVKNGLFQGTSQTQFSPNVKMTRGMFVTVLGRSAGVGADDFRQYCFSDVKTNQYYASYVKWAYDLGVIKGSGAGKFGPNDPLTRQDLVTMLYRYIEKKKGDTSFSDTTSYYGYNDAYSVSSYALDPMIWAVSHGIIGGVGNNTLSPKTYATRAQLAKIFMEAEAFLDFASSPEPEPEPKGFAEQAQTVSGAFEDKLREMTAGGTKEVSSDDVMKDLQAVAEGYVAKGYIKDLVTEPGGIFFTYTDGTPGGVILKLPQEELASQTSYDDSKERLSSTPTARTFAPTYLAAATTPSSSANVIGNKNVFFGFVADSKIGSSDMRTFENYVDKVKNAGLGFNVTVNYNMKIQDFKTLNQYGAIFLSLPGTYPRSSVIIDVPGEKLELWDDFKEDRQAGRVGLFSVISPTNNVNYSQDRLDGMILSFRSADYQTQYGILASRFFKYYYNSSNSFPNSFIHLGFNCSITAPKNGVGSLREILLNAGAGGVTGYSDFMWQKDDIKLTNAMIDTFLRKTDDRTIWDVSSTILDQKLTPSKGKIRLYKDEINWEIETLDVENYWHVAYKDSRANLVLWAPAEGVPSISGGTYKTYMYTPGGWSFSVYIYIDIHNALSVPLESVGFDVYFDGVQKAGLLGNAFHPPYQFPIQPGQTITQGMTMATVSNSDYDKCSEITIALSEYHTGSGSDIKIVYIPESEKVPIKLTYDGVYTIKW